MKNSKKATVNTLGNVCVTRHAYFDYINAEIPFEKADNFHWDFCGADNTHHNSARIYCNVPYEFAAETGLIRCPKRDKSMYDAKVCVIAKYTDRKAMKEIREIIGKKPEPLNIGK